jgi:hypothetical protein
LKCLGSATTLYGTVALSFVIPSEAEGSAVPQAYPGNTEYYTQTKIVISTGAQRSGEICGFLLLLTQIPKP